MGESPTRDGQQAGFLALFILVGSGQHAPSFTGPFWKYAVGA